MNECADCALRPIAVIDLKRKIVSRQLRLCPFEPLRYRAQQNLFQSFVVLFEGPRSLSEEAFEAA